MEDPQLMLGAGLCREKARSWAEEELFLLFLGVVWKEAPGMVASSRCQFGLALLFSNLIKHRIWMLLGRYFTGGVSPVDDGEEID